jgi:hypothetical protein
MAPANFIIPNLPTEFPFGFGMKNTGKIPKGSYRNTESVYNSSNVMVEAPNLLAVHPTSILYVYKVFQHLDMLWMVICVHPYTVLPVQVGGGF